MKYQVASGFNNEGSLSDITIQPACPGIKEARLIQAGDLSLIAEGNQHTELIYTVLPAEDRATVEADLGLTSAMSAEVTLSLPSNTDRTTFNNYNAVIYRPDPVDAPYRVFWQNLVYKVIIVEAL